MDNHYQPPKIWTNDSQNGGKFASTNRPTAGATHEQHLPIGNNPLQLYTLNTPNGIKINILLEELAELGIEGAQYDAYKIDIMNGDQFGSDFVAINPNSKIPALVDNSVNPSIKLFESGAILLYLAEKFEQFIPANTPKRAECLSWLFWQMGAAPYVGGGFGHFYAYAPEKFEYAINRFTMETKRQLDLLDQHLATHKFMVGNDYSIADMAIWAWYGQLALGKLYNAGEFLQVQNYTHLQRWAKNLHDRPAVQRAVTLPLQPIA